MTDEVFDVCVVGGGPAGLGFAQAWYDCISPGSLVLFDMGPEADSRSCTVQAMRGCRKAVPCEVVAGIGGSSGLAGGKLSDYPAGRGLAEVMGADASAQLEVAMRQLSEYVRPTAPSMNPIRLQSEIERFGAMSYELRHYQAHKYAQAELVRGWSRMVEELRAVGADVRTTTEVTSLTAFGQGYRLTSTTHGKAVTTQARAVVIATGRSESFLATSLSGQSARHPIDIGLRIEFPAEDWPDLDAVHGDLKLHFGNARTFCTSKSGWISPYRFGDIMLLEGRTDSSEKSDLSNLAITIRTDLPAEPLIEAVRRATLAQGPGSSIRQPLSDYLSNTVSPQATRQPKSSFSYWRWGDVNALFPPSVGAELREAVGRFTSEVLPRRAASNAQVFGPELDYYWATVPRVGSLRNVWAAGDVTGRYRGTLQAFAAGRYLVPEVRAELHRGSGAAL